MEFSQGKLTKFEWESIEIPESAEEKTILQMINDGYYNIDIHINTCLSMMSFLKMDSNYSEEYKNCIEVYIYNTYFKSIIEGDEIFNEKILHPKTKLKLNCAKGTESSEH